MKGAGPPLLVILSGSRTRSWGVTSGSGRGFVLVDETAENRSAPDLAVDRLGDRRFRACADVVAAPVRALGVVVRCERGQHPAEVPLAEDRHPAQEPQRHGGDHAGYQRSPITAGQRHVQNC
jgi:hypothetical protein